MNPSLILQFIGQSFILMGFAIIYSLFKSESFIHPIIRKFIMGITVSFVVIYLMYFNIPLDESKEFVFDVRSLALGLSGMFLGWIPTTMGLLSAIGYRIILGSDGVMLGILESIIGAVIGLSWRYLRLKKDNKHHFNISWVELYAIGFFMQVIILGLIIFLPADVRIAILNKIAIPQLVIFPLGFLFVAQFLLLQRKQYFDMIDLFKSEKEFKNLFNKNETMLMIIDPVTSRIIDVNNKSIEVYGYSKDEFLELSVEDLNQTDAGNVSQSLEAARTRKQIIFQRTHTKKNGQKFDVEIFSGPITFNGNEYLYSTIIDVTDKRQSERMFKDADERLRKTILSVAEGIIVTDEYARITLVNDKAKTLIDKDDQILRQRVYDVFRIYSNQHEQTFEEIYNECIKDNKTFISDFTYSLFKDDDQSLFIDFTLSPIEDNNGKPYGAILVIRDVTIEKKRQEEIRFMSKHDYLTKLYNRYNFEEELNRLNVERQHPISIILGDMNGLKLVNDAFGHLEGDKLLKAVADIFKKAVRSEDIVARWGGDEFVVLLPQTSYDDALNVINRINDLTEKSFYQTIKPSVAIGLATKQTINDSIPNVLNAAEQHMYKNKKINSPIFQKELIDKLITSLHKKIPNHEQHIERLNELIKRYSKHHNLDDKTKDKLFGLAKYNDIGRVTFDEHLVNNPNLSDQEKLQLQNHSEVGSRLVKTIPSLQHLSNPILHHHEWFNGEGYPSGLKGDQINQDARLFAILDAYEAMTRQRDGKPGKTHEEAIQEILAYSGKQFDPDYVKRFIVIFKEDN